MTHEKSYYKRFNCIGPGGRDCHCCYPPPGKERKIVERGFKRREKQESKKEVSQELKYS